VECYDNDHNRSALDARSNRADAVEWSWLTGRHPAPPELEHAIERLTGDPELASEIVALIPDRSGRETPASLMGN
jgi:hypothetical protein